MTVNRIPADAILFADPYWATPGHKRLLDFHPFGMGADTAVVLVAPWASWFGEAVRGVVSLTVQIPPSWLTVRHFAHKM